MKVVVAPDKYKGCLSAKDVALAIKKGLTQVVPEAKIEILPMADGGEGTVEALLTATGGKIISKRVTGPLGKSVDAYFGILGERTSTGVIEMAASSGLKLVPRQNRNPMVTTTYGTGELIRASLDEGCERVIVGIGDSATVDGGMGMAQALGVKFFDSQGKELGFGGKELIKIAKIDTSNLDRRILKSQFLVASDVDNPLCGRKGAAYVYGPQKGASPQDVVKLDKGLSNYAWVIEKDLGKKVMDVPGAGAAGGLGAGLIVFLHAQLKLGIDVVAEAMDLREKLKEADLVITGEGKMDSQTTYGKAPAGVAKLARERKVPVIAIVGEAALDPTEVIRSGISKVFSVVEVASNREEAMDKASYYVQQLAAHAMKDFLRST